MKNNYVLILGIFLVFGLVIVSKDSFANPVIDRIEEINLILNDIDNEEEFRDELIDYIDIIDDSLIPNSTFNISSKLNENYDFLTKFAISFILDNSEYYDIVIGEEYVYYDDYGNEYKTNKYIDVDKIYEITNSVFGVEYYHILNKYLDIKNDMIPLLILEEREFNSKIDSILEIKKYDNYIDVIVRYENNDLDYVYKLEYIGNRLYISDLSIRE